MRQRALLLACVVSALCSFSVPGHAQGTAPEHSSTPVAPSSPVSVAPTAPDLTPAYEADPRFVEAWREGKYKSHSSRGYADALDAFKKANKVAGGTCAACLREIYGLQVALGSYKDAVGTATQMKALAHTPVERSIAEADLGRALYRQAGNKPKPAQLEAAHAELQASLADYPKNLGARFSDGCVLAQMGKLGEAKQEFAQCAALAPASDPAKARAAHFAEDPELSTKPMAPAFEVTTSTGERFNLDNMQGHVVLIDFWATWCGPCNQELPHLQKIVKQFAGQPLTVISISWDQDEAKWKKFIAEHEMTWVQYRDADHSLTNRFGVPSIPHYFLIDSDGVMYPQMLSAEDDVSGKIKKFLSRAKDRPAATTVASVN